MIIWWMPDDRLVRICALFKDRCETLVDLANWAKLFYVDSLERNAEDYAKHVTEAANPILDAFAAAMETVEWEQEAIAASIKEVLESAGHQDACFGDACAGTDTGYCTHAIGGCGAGIAGT